MLASSAVTREWIGPAARSGMYTVRRPVAVEREVARVRVAT